MSIGRISTAETYRSAIGSVTDAQGFVNRIQEQLATGKKILTPADDPVASAQITGLRTQLQRLESFQVNTLRAEAALSYEDSVLQGVEGVLRRARDLVVQSGNAALDASGLTTLGTEIGGLIDQLVALGNTQSADGEYIFGGFASTTPPYELAGGAVVENPTSGRRETNIASGLTVFLTTPASSIFNAEPGNGGFTVYADAANSGTGFVNLTRADSDFDDTQDYTLSFQLGGAGELEWVVTDSLGAVTSGAYTDGAAILFDGGSGSITLEGTPAVGDSFAITGNQSAAPVPTARTQSAFQTLVTIRDALLGDNSSQSGQAIARTALNQSLENLDQNLAQVALARTDIGVRLNRVDSQIDLNSAFNVQLESTLAGLESLDYAEAISELNLQLVALEAAQQTFVKTTGLTLFNYL